MKIKPCPFCGAEYQSFRILHRKNCFFWCDFISVRPIALSNKEIKAWNRRAKKP